MHMADLCVLENTLFKCFHKINYDKCADLSENLRCRWMQKCDGVALSLPKECGIFNRSEKDKAHCASLYR